MGVTSYLTTLQFPYLLIEPSFRSDSTLVCVSGVGDGEASASASASASAGGGDAAGKVELLEHRLAEKTAQHDASMELVRTLKEQVGKLETDNSMLQADVHALVEKLTTLQIQTMNAGI